MNVQKSVLQQAYCDRCKQRTEQKSWVTKFTLNQRCTPCGKLTVIKEASS